MLAGVASQRQVLEKCINSVELAQERANNLQEKLVRERMVLAEKDKVGKYMYHAHIHVHVHVP